MKFDSQFDLESAGWPAVLVDSQGVMCRASQGAFAVFGSMLEHVYLASIWGAGNELTAEQFLGRPDLLTAPPAKIKFRTKGNMTLELQVLVSGYTRDGQKCLVLQMFPAGSALPLVEGQSISPEAKAQLAEAVQQKQKLDCALKLARTVALDFNNALTSILGHISLILEKMEPDHPWRRSLMEAEKAAERGAEIANDLAAFSRQEKDVRAQQTGNLNAVLRRTVEVFQKPGPSQSIHVEWHLDLESRLYSANFDEAKMQQAFVKVVENAVQAIPKERRGKVQVSCRNLELSEPTHDQSANLAPGSYVCVEVKDDGCGIASDMMPRIFEPFFTTKYGHRGLGLAWVYGIITNHGGNVAISSELDHGTSVRVYLPANKKFVKDTARKIEELHGSETILMVDDEDLLLTMGQMVLSAFGYKVLTATSGEKALALIKKGGDRIDLLITDLVMPQMSGRELAEKVRELLPDTKILFSSGYVRPASGEEDNYLQKPFTSQGLVHKVKQVLSTQ
ncbi:MAG: ATP-binding protein [Verrucomicrobiota bacterium]